MLEILKFLPDNLQHLTFYLAENFLGDYPNAVKYLGECV